MYKRLYTFLNKNNVIQNLQFGFRQQYSISRALINITENIRKALCYVICNCNVANKDIVALYLSERLNSNLYFTLERFIFSVRMYTFLSALVLSVRRKIRQMQPQERRRQIL